MTSTLLPLEREVAVTPMASAPLETSAMALSPASRLPRLRRSSRNAARTTTGSATASGAAPSASATAMAPKPTWESPSPIME